MTEPAGQLAGPPVRGMYRLSVEGPIPADLVRGLGRLTVSVDPAETVLSGTLADETALFQHLVRIHDLGLRLLGVRRLTHPEPDG